jgi:hypothetical protein
MALHPDFPQSPYEKVNRLVPATPEIGRVFGFDAVHEALRLMQQGVHFGKVLVEFP